LNVFFDLDGTLTNPGAGISRCIVHALEALGCVPPPAAALRDWIGPPLADSFRSWLGGADESLVREAVALYRERFEDLGMFENEVYVGIPESLDELRDRGFRLWVVTSKPTVYADRIVRHFDLARCFEGIHGSELDGTRSGKGELLAHVLAVEGIAPATAVMIGDRSHDVRGARENGVRAIGVLWGYGARAELVAAGADALLRSPIELGSALGGAGTS